MKYIHILRQDSPPSKADDSTFPCGLSLNDGAKIIATTPKQVALHQEVSTPEISFCPQCLASQKFLELASLAALQGPHQDNSWFMFWHKDEGSLWYTAHSTRWALLEKQA